MLIGAVLTAIATIVVLGLHPEMEELYRRVAEAARQMMAEMSPEAPIQTFSDDAMLAFLRVLWPIVQSAQMMIALFAGYYFASRILSAAGRGTRPREDIPSSLRMNRLAIAVLLAGIALMFAGTAATAIGASFAGAVAAGFLMSGFAIIHNMVRGKSWALPVLVLVYLLTMIMPLIGLALILAGGLANPRRAIALTPTKPNPDSNEPT